MRKSGVRPKGQVSIRWSADFAYAIGLLASDGYLSQNGNYISLVSKDREQVQNFISALKLKPLTIGTNLSGSRKSMSYRVQFGDVLFHAWLKTIGITAKKSKTIGALAVPDRFFFDFLRGVFDGDGSFYSYYDKRWKCSFMFYLIFASGSKKFIYWLRQVTEKKLGVRGHISEDKKKSVLQLKYAKAESLKIIKKMYYSNSVPCLKRKRTKIFTALKQVGA
jgi:intein/homing endonuclease